MLYRPSSILLLLLCEIYRIIAYTVDVSIGEKAVLSFTFAQSSNISNTKVQWIFHPLSSLLQNNKSLEKDIILHIGHELPRYSTDLSTVACSEMGSSISSTTSTYSTFLTCRRATLTIDPVMMADEGLYKFQVIGGSDCSPCMGGQHLRVVPQPVLDEQSDGTAVANRRVILHNVSTFLNALPFDVHFTMNSSVCVRQDFEFQCNVEPSNYGLNLTLYRLDPLFTYSTLLALSNRQGRVDFRNTTTRPIQTFTQNGIDYVRLQYSLPSVGKGDEGGYLCVVSVPNMEVVLFEYMFLQVDDCGNGGGGLSSSATALTAICLLLVTLLLGLAMLVACITYRSKRFNLQFLNCGTKKWNLAAAASKVVREPNLLYPWALSPPSTQCTQHQNQATVNNTAASGSSASYIALESAGAKSPAGKNLQVPVVIIQMEKSLSVGAADVSLNGKTDKCKPGTYRIPNDPIWEVPRESLCLGKQIGAGAFGVVFAGTVCDPYKVLPGLRRELPAPLTPPSIRRCRDPSQELTVAVKTLRDNFTEQDLADLVREMEILKQFDPHPHVIQLYGTCTQNGRLQVLVELAPHGNLRDFLVDRRPNSGHKSISLPLSYLSTRHLVSFGLQVARGMNYLTRLNIVHRDLAARNILIGNRFVAKISDFGLTRTACDYYRKCSDGRLPIKWMAPESIFDRRYTAKSDVWSFGILLWEIFSFGGTPYPTHSAESLLNALQLGYRNERPQASPDAIYSIMCSCWSVDSEARPTFCQLVDFLRQAYTECVCSRSVSTPSSSSSISLTLPASSSSTSTFQSSPSSPTVSTIYLTLNTNDRNAIVTTTMPPAGDSATSSAVNQSLTVQQLPHQNQLGEQWAIPASTCSRDCQTVETGTDVLVNSCYLYQDKYLQSLHKAFYTSCNYVLPPRLVERNTDCLGSRS